MPPRQAERRGPSWRLVGWLVGLLAVGLVVGAAWVVYRAGEPTRLRARAEAASRAGDAPAALAAWRRVNARPESTGATWLAQARAALAVGRLGEAQQALNRATALEPASVEAWRLWIELLRVQDRTTDAQRVGWLALEVVAPAGRRAVLRDLSFALLADVPDDIARASLARWAEAEAQAAPRTAGPGSGPDPDARVALLARMGAMPRAGDLDRGSRIAELADVLARDPAHLPAREALAATLLDGGEAERARDVLDAWPASLCDARYWRLLGRYDLEYTLRNATGPEARNAAVAAAARRSEASFRRALAELPHDWKTRVRLARTLRILGRDAEARGEALAVARLRERLDPAALTPRLNRAEPADLADLAAGVGLDRLAAAWRRLAAEPAGGPPISTVGF